jgi:prephenate dehydrogenase
LKIAIIGGAGKMGQWIARYLSTEDVEIAIADKRNDDISNSKLEITGELRSEKEAVIGAEVVVMSVPIESLEEAARTAVPYIDENQILIDISSIKSKPIEILHKYYKNNPILGIHPMFGPGAKSIYQKNFVLTPTNEREETLADSAERYLKERGAAVYRMSPREHDKLMTIVLGLPSFIAIITADTLLENDKLDIAVNVCGSSYRMLQMLIESVIEEDANLYATLQTNLPGMIDLAELYKEKIGNWIDLIKASNKKEMIDKMNAMSQSFKRIQPDFEETYEKMYRIMEQTQNTK